MTAAARRVVRHDTPEAFLARAREFLLATEVEHNLHWGLCLRLVAHPERADPELHLLTVETDGRIVAAALRSGPHKWVLSQADDEAIAAIVERLASEGWPVPGVLGPAAVAARFAGLWAARTGKNAEPGLRQCISELRTLVPPRACPGAAREAGAADVEAVAQWARAFVADTGNRESPDEVERAARYQVADGGVLLWDDGGPVSMAATSRGTPHGTCVSLVYTPPAFRRRGYASIVVAALSARILAGGKAFAFLFTDLANPTSNGIYERIGYRRVAEWADWWFA